MFKAQVLRRNFSLFNRLPHARLVRSAARDGHESITIHRVRIRRRLFSRSRLVGAVAIGVITYGLGKAIGIEVEVGEVEEEDKKSTRTNSPTQDGEEGEGGDGEVEEEEGEDEEYVNAILFLPTGFSRPSAKTFYRGSDPEWQAFRKLATDRPRVEKIRGELATCIRALAAKSPQYVARLGKVDVEKGKAWVEFKFPDGPPVEYERPGLALTDDLEWRKASRPVENSHHHRLNKALYPTEVANALYQDTKRKTIQSWKHFRVYMGWDEESKSDTVKDLIQRIGANPPSSSPASPPANPTPGALSASPAKDTQQPAASPSAAPVDGPANALGFILPDPKKMTLDLSQFRADFSKAFKPYPFQSPRGAFTVMALIEVYGDKARMTLNVTAIYDPQQGKYIGLGASVWNYVEHRQAPRGGP
ncbi:hypothetical protein EJ02DRAFT_404155 [Clathrospora elynae]|uniref:Uncharacterized protein n=1 Tax=Clathrospora elynae TaxID=706981 RepID=A0A6A5SP85_9PLEO|nr:hypothetical protein EJ02DRAFT_404155 [Clathrospora elynae]